MNKKILKFILLPISIFFVLFSIFFKMNLTYTIIASFVFTFAINLIIGIIGIPIIIAKKLAQKNIKSEKLNKDDFFKTTEIYREILKNYSPGILSYIDNMNFKFEPIVIASLLNLKQKKYIDFNNNQVFTLNVSNNINLNLSENYILNSISNGKVNISKDTLQKKIIEDSLKENLILPNTDISKSLKKQLIKLLVSFIFILITVHLAENFSTFIGTIATIALLTFFPIIVPTYIITYFRKYTNDPFFRTKKGKALNKKLEGLRKYIREYSLLKEKKENSLEIWEDYLIYSVILEQNDTIQKNLLQCIILN